MPGNDTITVPSAADIASSTESAVSSTMLEAEDDKDMDNQRPRRACTQKPHLIANGAVSEAELNSILPLSEQELEKILDETLFSDSFDDEDFVPGKHIILHKADNERQLDI